MNSKKIFNIVYAALTLVIFTAIILKLRHYHIADLMITLSLIAGIITNVFNINALQNKIKALEETQKQTDKE